MRPTALIQILGRNFLISRFSSLHLSVSCPIPQFQIRAMVLRGRLGGSLLKTLSLASGALRERRAPVALSGRLVAPFNASAPNMYVDVGPFMPLNVGGSVVTPLRSLRRERSLLSLYLSISISMSLCLRKVTPANFRGVVRDV